MKKYILFFFIFLIFFLFPFIFSSDIRCLTFIPYGNFNLPVKTFDIKINGKKYNFKNIVKIKNAPKSYKVLFLATSGVAKNFGNCSWLIKGLLYDFSFEDDFQLLLSSSKGVKELIPETSDKLTIEKKMYNFLPYMLFDGAFERNFRNISPLKNKNLNPLENALITLSKLFKKRDLFRKSCIVIFTDGTLNIDIKKIKPFFKNPVTTFIIYISDKKSKYFKSILQFAKIAGGKVFFVESHSLSLPSISGAIKSLLENSYNFQVDLSKYKKSKLKIKIENIKDKNIKIIYPHFILK